MYCVRSTLKNTCDIFSDFLNLIDIFRFPFLLKFNGHYKNSTYTGKIITLGIIIFIIYSFFTSDMINKKNPQTLIQDLSQKSRPELYFSRENFTFIAGIADSTNTFIADETIYFFNICQEYLNNAKGIDDIECTRLKLCTPEDFIDQNEFFRLGLNGTYCLPNKTFKTAGYWDEEIMEDFWLSLKSCENSTEENSIVCKSIEEIENFLQRYYVQIYISNSNIDAANYLNPSTQTLKIFYQALDPKIYKMTSLFMKKTVIYTDDGFLFESSEKRNAYLQGQLDNDYALRENNPRYKARYFYLNIFSSDYQTEITRKYQKIQSILAELGGILNFLFFFGIVLSHIENQYKTFTVISNDLFIFPREETLIKPIESQAKNQPPKTSNIKPMNFSSKLNRIGDSREIPIPNTDVVSFTTDNTKKRVLKKPDVNESENKKNKGNLQKKKIIGGFMRDNLTAGDLDSYQQSKKREFFFDVGYFRFVKFYLRQY